jgi:streptomycin 6-kinase
MHIPAHLKTKILNIYGDKGSKWIENFPEVLDRCIKKWHLTLVTAHTQLSYNMIFYATSSEHGQVVLKMGVPDKNLSAEVRSLNFLGISNACKCYDYDATAGAILLERIIPGSDLNSVPDLNERIEIVSELINRTIIPANDAKDFPHYSEWLERAFKRARDKSSSNSKLMMVTDEAEKLFAQIAALYLPLYFLHGDIHHTNILMDSSGRWRLIDPQGVLGIKAFSPAVFIENQIRMTAPEAKADSLNQMLAKFSKSLNEPGELIAMCLFIDKVLSICWDVEDGVGFENMGEDLEDCELVYSFVNF